MNGVCVYVVELARWVWQWWVGVFCVSVKTMKGQHFIREVTVFHYSRWWTISVVLSVTKRSRGINSHYVCTVFIYVCVCIKKQKPNESTGQTVLSTLGHISLNIFNRVGSCSIQMGLYQFIKSKKRCAGPLAPKQHPSLVGTTSALERFLLTESQTQPWLPRRRVRKTCATRETKCGIYRGLL